MPYELHWQDDKHSIARLDIYGDVSWDQFHVGVNKMSDAIGTVTHRVDVIFNDKVGMPAGNPMPHLKASILKLNAHPNLGLIYTVSDRQVSAPVKMLVTLLMRVYKIDQKHIGGFVRSLEEALADIDQQRANTSARV